MNCLLLLLLLLLLTIIIIIIINNNNYYCYYNNNNYNNNNTELIITVSGQLFVSILLSSADLQTYSVRLVRPSIDTETHVVYFFWMHFAERFFTQVLDSCFSHTVIVKLG